MKKKKEKKNSGTLPEHERVPYGDKRGENGGKNDPAKAPDGISGYL